MTLSYLYSKIIKRLHGKSLKNCIVDRTCRIYSECAMYNCTFGPYTYVSYNSKFINTKVGAFCSIADNVLIGGDEHPIDWVSTSPVFHNVKNSGSTKRFSSFDLPSPEQTVIGNDVWIGHGAIIKAGVNIGNGAVIGAGSVVTKNVPPYAIAAGVPAKVIRFRFDEETINRLQASEWWKLPDEKLTEAAKYIKNPMEFLEKLSNENNSL